MKEEKLNITEGSKKRCREKFPYKGIGKLINNATKLFEVLSPGVIMSECIYDYSDPEMYNVLLYLLRENGTKEIVEELKDFNYLDI